MRPMPEGGIGSSGLARDMEMLQGENIINESPLGTSEQDYQSHTHLLLKNYSGLKQRVLTTTLPL